MFERSIIFRRLQHSLLCVAIALGLTIVSVAQTPSQTPIDLVISGGFAFDVEMGTFVPNEGLGVHAGRFVPAKEAQSYLRLQDDQYILPGFIDCHAHYNVRLIDRRREEFDTMPILYLANGATVTFSCGEFDPEGMLALRQRIESGEQVGPRLITSGPYFGRARPGWARDKPEEEIRAEVDYWAERGSGGFKAKSIDAESLRVLIDQAHQHGLTVTGHLGSGYRGSVNPQDAIAFGIDRIEHFLGGDAMPADRSAYQSLPQIRAGSPEFAAICNLFVTQGVFFDCTLTAYGYLGRTPENAHEEFQYWIDERQFFTPYMQKVAAARAPPRGMEIYQRIYQAKQDTIADFHRAGGMITLGTDHVSDGNYVAGFGVHREMDALVRAGIPARDVLRVATINGAKALGIDQDHGSIAIGKVADLVIVRGNPLENIRHTRQVLQVVRAGQIFDAAELLADARGKIGPRSEAEEGEW